MEHRRRVIANTAVIIIAAWVYLYIQGLKNAPQQELNIVSITYFVSLLPLMLYFGRSEKNIPYVAIFGIVYFGYFAYPVFDSYNFLIEGFLDPGIISKSNFMILLGIIFFVISFYIFPGKTLEYFLPHFSIDLDYRKAYKFGIHLSFWGYIVYFLGRRYSQSIASQGTLAFFWQLPLLSILIFYLLYLQKALTLRGKFLLFAIFMPVRFMNLLAAGGFGPLCYETASLLFVYFYCRQKIAWGILFTITIPYFLIWGARDEFRALTWGGIYEKKNTYQKALVYLELIYKRTSGQRTSAITDSYERLAIRSNQLFTLAKVVELTPEYIPYWDGYTYKSFFTSFIPRFLYPGKPQKILGQEFGHRYSLLHDLDLITSYNLPMIVEMYINFGLIGIMVGMFILGGVIRAVYALTNHPKSGEGGFLIGAISFCNLLNIESDFSLIFGNILQYAILFSIVLKKIQLRKREAGVVDIKNDDTLGTL